jgi:hypothetical protein
MYGHWRFFMAATKPPHNGAQATEDLYGFIQLPRQHLNQILPIFFLAVFTFLLFFLLRSAGQTLDSLAYALSAKTGDEMFHPHHLLYIPFIHVFHLLISQICRPCNTIFSAQVFNILWAITAVIAIFLVVRKLLDSSLAGLSAALLLLVSQGFWLYSTQVEVYVPALGSLAFLVAIALAHRNVYLTTPQILGAALLWALAVFFHQTNILFVIPLGLFLVMQEGRHGYQTLVKIICLATLLILVGYVIAFFFTPEAKTLVGFFQFSLNYAVVPDPAWGTLDNVSPRGVQQLLNRQSWNFVTVSPDFEQVLILSLAISTMAMVGWNLWRVFRHASHAAVRALLLAWLASYFLFFLWWLPREREFFIVTLFPMIVLAFLTLDDLASRVVFPYSRKLIPLSVIVLAGALLVMNLQSTILPSHASMGSGYRKASNLATIAPPQCVIVNDNLVINNLRYYFNPAQRGVNVRDTLIYFYQSEPLPENRLLSGGDCIIAELKYVDPGYKIRGFNGHKSPSEWFHFMGWLFDFEYDSERRLVSTKGFEVRRSYLIILPSRQEVDGLRQFLALLDRQIDEHSNTKVDSFQKWISTACTSNRMSKGSTSRITVCQPELRQN